MNIDRIEAYSDDVVCREYLSGMRDCFAFNPFCHNAAVHQEKIAAELLRRGITAIPNIFGAIEVKANWRKFTSDQVAARATRGYSR